MRFRTSLSRPKGSPPWLSPAVDVLEVCAEDVLLSFLKLSQWRIIVALMLLTAGCAEPQEPLEPPLFADGRPAELPPRPRIRLPMIPAIPARDSKAGQLRTAVRQVETIVAEIYAGRGVLPESVAKLESILESIEPPASESDLHTELLAIAHGFRRAVDGEGVKYELVDAQIGALRSALRMTPRSKDLEPLQLAAIMMQSIIVEHRCQCSRRRLRVANRLMNHPGCPETQLRECRRTLALVEEFCRQSSPESRRDALHAVLKLNTSLQLDGEQQCLLIEQYRDRLPL